MRSPSQDSGRRHSVSSTEEEFVRPHRGRVDDRTHGPRRIRLPRSKSASDMLEVYNNADPATREEDLRNIVREQVDREAVRELAEFLRTTGPRIHPGYRDDECFRVPTHGNGHARWSLQQLKTKKVRFERTSLQQLPESARPGTTTQGNRYIAISVPNPDSLGGPWSRSQYPVYAVASPETPVSPDHAHWPPRGSSRGALSPTTEAFPSITESPKSPMAQKTLYLREADSNSLAELNKNLEQHLSSAAVHGDQQPEVDRSPHPDSDDETAIISIRRRGSTAQMSVRKRSGTASTYRTSRLRVNMDDTPTVQVESVEPVDLPQEGNNSEFANVRVHSPVTPPCVAPFEEPKLPEVRVEGVERPSSLSLRVHKRGLSTFPPMSAPGSSPTSPRKARPANIAVGSTLMVPKESPLPDSPGFPGMLAAMTFPSPPKGSPSHSPSASIASSGSRPNSIQGAVVQSTKSRPSSSRSANNPMSLDEVVMQPAQTPSTMEESEDGLDTPRNTHGLLTFPDHVADERHEVDERDGRPQSSSSLATTRPDRCESSGSFYTADESHRFSTLTADFDLDPDGYMHDPYDLSEMSTVSHRQSQMTDNSYRQSGITDESYRQSTRSDSTAATDFSNEDGFGKSLRLNRLILRSSISDAASVRKGSLAESTNSADDDRSFYSSERSDTPSSLRSTLTDEDLHPKSILERRMARKAKVREYKQKDLATVRTPPMNALLAADSVDSPVLGWFTQPSSKPKRISILSPLSRSTAGAVSSTSPTTPTHPVTSAMPDTPVSQESFVRIHKRRANMDASNSPRTSIAESNTPRDWSISPVMVLESTPTHSIATMSSPTRVAFERKDLTLSPMILVAESVGHSGPKPTSLRPLSLLTETAPVLPPRSSLRLKVRPQRPLPIKVAGVATSTIPEVPSESKVRHSISMMPTPPMSPEVKGPNRMSFPVLAQEPKSTDTPSDRVSLQRRREKQIIQQNEKKENEWLKAHQKEREQEWRIAAIKDRLRLEKMEKDKETGDLVAPPAESQLSPVVASPALTESEQANGGSKRFSVEIEQRLERLEKSGDAYLRIMVPLLENMNRTLAEMRKDGVGAGTTNMGLRMSDFVLDMRNESDNRMSIADPMSTPSSAKASTPTFHSAGHIRHRSGSKSSMGSQKMAARVEMNMSRPRSRRNTQTSSRGDNTMASSKKSDEMIRRSNDTYLSGRMSPEKKPLPSVPQSSLEDIADTSVPAPPPKDEDVPRTPKEHQMEAQQAIQRRMEKQEAIFDQLMTGWGIEKKKPRPRSSTLPSRPAPSTEEPESS